MKYLFTLLLAVSFFACDENKTAAEVPAAVTAAFNSAYPGATDVEWEEEADGSFDVEFDFNGEEMEATYSATGELLEMEED